MSNVINLFSIKNKKSERQKSSLKISNQTGKITTTKDVVNSNDIDDIKKIHTSLEKINRLIAEIKKMGDDYVNDNEN